MPWVQALPLHRPLIEDFIRSREHYCASLSSRIRDPAANRIRLPDKSRAVMFLELSYTPALTIISLYYLEKAGFSFIIFPDPTNTHAPTNTDQQGMRALIAPWLKPLFSCMGREADCALFRKIFAIRPTHELQYVMMKRKAAGVIERRPEYEIRRGDARHIEELLPLHIAYEQEEVVLPGQSMNLGASVRHFRHILQTERLFFLKIDGRVVAKVQTNARGLGVEQMGGVFTFPDMRNRGIASQLVEHLAREIIGNDKTAALFVKRTNQAAISLYQKCGFTTDCHFTIFYLC